MGKLQPFTIDLEPGQIAALERMAKAQERTPQGLVREAVESYMLAREVFEREVAAALTEADAGDFVPQAQMAAFWADLDAYLDAAEAGPAPQPPAPKRKRARAPA